MIRFPPRDRLPRKCTSLACLVALFFLCGCRDSGSGDSAVLVAPETYGALDLGISVPSLPVLATAWGVDGELAPQLAAWADSWNLGPAEGLRIRLEIYEAALPILLSAMPVAELERQVGSLGLGLELTQAIPDGGIPGEFEDALSVASKNHDLAMSTLGVGRLEDCLRYTLLAADALQGISPQAIAALMVQQAQSALRRAEGSQSYSLQELERAQRLVAGATLALDDGDSSLAIRRAFYACRLLKVDLR